MFQWNMFRPILFLFLIGASVSFADDLKRNFQGATDWLGTPKQKHLQSVNEIELSQALNSPAVFEEKRALPPDNFPLQQILSIPPIGIPVTPNDQLVLRLYSADQATIILVARCLTSTNSIQTIVYSVQSGTARTKQEFSVPIPSGATAIISATISTSTASIRRGRIWATVRLISSGTQLEQSGLQNPLSGSPLSVTTLIADYVITGITAQFGGVLKDSLDGSGLTYFFSTPIPLPGAEFSYIAPQGVAWKLKSINAILTTSAVAGNRVPSLLIENVSPAGVTGIFGSPVNQAPNTAVRYEWIFGLQQYADATVSGGGFQKNVIIPVPIDTLLYGGDVGSAAQLVIQSQTQNRDIVGDQWGAINMLVEEWIVVSSE